MKAHLNNSTKIFIMNVSAVLRFITRNEIRNKCILGIIITSLINYTILNLTITIQKNECNEKNTKDIHLKITTKDYYSTIFLFSFLISLLLQ